MTLYLGQSCVEESQESSWIAAGEPSDFHTLNLSLSPLYLSINIKSLKVLSAKNPFVLIARQDHEAQHAPQMTAGNDHATMGRRRTYAKDAEDPRNFTK